MRTRTQAILPSDRTRRATAPGGPRTLVVKEPGSPFQPELRNLMAAGLIPDVVRAEDAVGSTILDERYFAAHPGVRRHLLSRLPLPLAQLAEVILQGRRYDAVLTWTERNAILVGALMRVLPRRPGHVAILMWPSSKPKKVLLLRLVQRGLDRLIVCSPLQRRYLEAELGMSPECFVDARWPVDTDFWRPMSGAGDLICSVGQEMRDYPTLLTALGSLNIPCHIAAGTSVFGRTSAGRQLQGRDAHALPPHVSVGAKSFAELRELYARSRFVVVPLVPSDSDNGITTILESFAMGKAVICTRTAGQIGVLEPGVNCLTVPPGDPHALRDAIRELWDDPMKCARLGAAGRAFVTTRHGLDRWTQALVRAVDQAAAAHPSAGQSSARS